MAELDTMLQPLASLQVLDLCYGPMSAIGRNLADLGAQIMCLPPANALADQVNIVGKCVVDMNRQEFFEYLAKADILLWMQGAYEDVSLDQIQADFPTLVILAISDFGRESPCAHWQATEPVLYALSGALSRSGIPGRAPLLPPSGVAYGCAVAQALYLVLLAHWNKLQNKVGELIDFAILDAVTEALDPLFGMGGSATAGLAGGPVPAGRPEARHMYPIFPCADGFVRICILAPRQWQGMFTWLGKPEEFSDPSFNTLQKRFATPALNAAIAGHFANQIASDLEQQAIQHGVPIATVLPLSSALESPHMKARAAMRAYNLPFYGTATIPAGIMEIDGHRSTAKSSLPGNWKARPAACAPVNAPRFRPLAGQVVLDFGVIVAGAEAGRVLADQGADVIKIETNAFPDGMRQTYDGGAISLGFALGHRNQRALGLNLREAEGRHIFLRLAARSDIILSNFKPGTLESLGLSNEVLLQANPRLIIAGSSAYGSTGPWSRRLGYGPLVRAAAGLTHQWRYPDDAESFSDAITIYPDHACGRITAFAAVALLIRRYHTGKGGSASLAQSEVMLSHLAPTIAALSLGLSLPAPYAAYGPYPCRGEDQWCVITLSGHEARQSLCRIIGRPDLADDPEADWQPALRDWLQHIEPKIAMHKLQENKIAAGAMLRGTDLPNFPHFIARETFCVANHPKLPAPFTTHAAPARTRNIKPPEQRPAPLMGEHSAEIMREFLDMPDEDILSLFNAGILEKSSH